MAITRLDWYRAGNTIMCAKTAQFTVGGRKTGLVHTPRRMSTLRSSVLYKSPVARLVQSVDNFGDFVLLFH